MGDWEDENIPPLQKEQPKNKWDDEDVDENDVKDSWEDEDEPASVSIVKPLPEAILKKQEAKTTEMKGKTAGVQPEQPLDPLAENLRQQK